jgi:hypothetical protein
MIAAFSMIGTVAYLKRVVAAMRKAFCDQINPPLRAKRSHPAGEAQNEAPNEVSPKRGLLRFAVRPEGVFYQWRKVPSR